MAKSSKKSGAKAYGISIVLNAEKGTKLDLAVELKKVAKSSAGSSRVPLKNGCRVHKAPINRIDVCKACGPDPLAKENIIKLYEKAGPDPLVLEPAWVEERRVKGDGSMSILEFIEIGPQGEDDLLFMLSPETSFVLPSGDDAATKKKYAMLHAMLCKVYEGQPVPARIAVVKYITRGTASPRTVHGILRALDNGLLVMQERWQPEDTYEAPEIDLPTLAEAEIKGLAAKGRELSLGKVPTPELFTGDEARAAIAKLLEELADGIQPEDITEPAPAAQAAEDDIDILGML